MFIRSRPPEVNSREPPRAARRHVAVPPAPSQGPAAACCDLNDGRLAARGTSSTPLARHGRAPDTHRTAPPPAASNSSPQEAWGVAEEPHEPVVLESEPSTVSHLPPTSSSTAAAAAYVMQHPTHAGVQSGATFPDAAVALPRSLDGDEHAPLNLSAALPHREGDMLPHPQAYPTAVVPHVYADASLALHLSPLDAASPGESRHSTSHLAYATTTSVDRAAEAERESLTRSTTDAPDVCRPLLQQQRQPKSDNAIATAATAGQAPAAPPNLTTVSALGRTLAAAASALTAAAQREREREQEAARVRVWEAQQAGTVDRDATVAVLFELAVKEKALLMETFLSGWFALTQVMDECTALRRREELRRRQSEVDKQLADGRETRRRVAVYREHVAAAQDRSLAEEGHARAMQEADRQVQLLRAELASVTQHAREAEAQLEEQDHAHAHAMAEVHAAMTEQSMELRALQRAHGQATERWLTTLTLYEGVRRDIAPVLLQRVRPAPVRDHGVGSPQPVVQTSAVSSESRFLQQVLESAHIRIAAKAVGTSGNGRPSDRGELPAAQAPESGGATGGEASPPTALGGLSSPPGTALPLAVSPAVAEVPPVIRCEPPDGCSPDPAIVSLNDLDDKDKCYSTSTDALAEAAVVARAGDSWGSGELRSSSCRPSRLNSVASTRRGSWEEPLNEVIAAEPRCSEEEGTVDAITEVPVAVTTAAGAGVALNDTAGEVMAGLPRLPMPAPGPQRRSDAATQLSSSLDSRSGGGAGSLEDVYATLEAAAAAAVQRECARLLDLGALECERCVAPTCLRKPWSAGVAKPQRNGVDAPQGGVALGEHLSLPRGSPGVPLSVTAQRCMRVGEVAHTMARLLSRLLERLRKFTASLQQRVALLEAKDWNRTMAHQFIAVDHVSAVQRLVVDVERVLNAGAHPAAIS